MRPWVYRYISLADARRLQSTNPSNDTRQMDRLPFTSAFCRPGQLAPGCRFLAELVHVS